MRFRYFVILSFFCATCALASDDPLDSLKKGQPKDVSDLIDRLVGCNHWSGEEPYDAERKKEISSAIADLKCTRLAKDVAAARKRYASNPGTIKALDQAQETSY
jgi:cytochrome c556